jgi:hypothetical protein
MRPSAALPKFTPIKNGRDYQALVQAAKKGEMKAETGV